MTRDETIGEIIACAVLSAVILAIVAIDVVCKLFSPTSWKK